MAEDNQRLSRQARYAIERARRGKQCLVSVISVWEFGQLIARGRYSVKGPPAEFLRDAFTYEGLSVEPLSVEVAWEAAALPLHGDPADRILVATARALDATLLTADGLLLDQRLCKTMSAC